jgi:dTDP-4-dehydrorhamnose reductase
MKILLFGANGQLGTAFRALAASEAFPLGWTLRPVDSNECDLASSGAVRAVLERENPDLVVNAAAYTAVDLAETERDRCEAVNALAPGIMGAFCRERGIPLVHYSSDYVYSGDGAGARDEQEPVAPLNFYGASKARGDQAVIESGCEHLIFRTSWVFSHTGKNFVKTMLKIGASRRELRVVDDQTGSPTYAPDLARCSLEALMRALEATAVGKAFPSGVYHLANTGFTSWAGFARAILPSHHVSGIPSPEYPTPARRPLNSRLSLSRFVNTFGVHPRPWQEALADCLKALKENPDG